MPIKITKSSSKPECAHEEALYPFQPLYMELASYEDQQLLILIDQLSSFPQV